MHIDKSNLIYMGQKCNFLFDLIEMKYKIDTWLDKGQLYVVSSTQKHLKGSQTQNQQWKEKAHTCICIFNLLYREVDCWMSSSPFALLILLLDHRLMALELGSWCASKG